MIYFICLIFIILFFSLILYYKYINISKCIYKTIFTNEQIENSYKMIIFSDIFQI